LYKYFEALGGFIKKIDNDNTPLEINKKDAVIFETGVLTFRTRVY